MADSLTNKITLGGLQRALSRLWGYITDRLANKADKSSVDAAFTSKQEAIDSLRSESSYLQFRASILYNALQNKADKLPSLKISFTEMLEKIESGVCYLDQKIRLRYETISTETDVHGVLIPRFIESDDIFLVIYRWDTSRQKRKMILGGDNENYRVYPVCLYSLKNEKGVTLNNLSATDFPYSAKDLFYRGFSCDFMSDSPMEVIKNAFGTGTTAGERGNSRIITQWGKYVRFDKPYRKSCYTERLWFRVVRGHQVQYRENGNGDFTDRCGRFYVSAGSEYIPIILRLKWNNKANCPEFRFKMNGAYK